MKKIFTLIGCLLSIGVFSQIDIIRISQVYGGGGNTGATYNQDFVEIYNISGAEVNIGNWSVQYASATGPGGSGNWDVAVIPAGTIIENGKYYLIGLAKASTGSDLPTPDVVNTTIDLAVSAGKVALVKNSIPLNGATACSDVNIADLVGYGTTASCSRTANAATTGIDNTKSLLRGSNGCANLFNNATDFAVGPVAPRNGNSPGWSCFGPTLSASSIVSGISSTAGVASIAKSFNLSGLGLTGAPGNITVNAGSINFEVSLSSSSGFGASVTIPYTSFSLESTPVYVRVSAVAPLGAVNTTIIFSGGGASNSVAVSGNVLSAEPTVQASNLTVGSIANTGLAVKWTSGNGASRIVTIRPTAIAAINPTDGSIYATATDITNGSTTGPGNYVVYYGTGNGEIIITGLTAGTDYTISVFESNGSNGSINYLTTTAAGNPVSATTTGASEYLKKVNFTAITVPLYMGSGAGNGIPTMFYARVSNLIPNSIYYYYTQAGVDADLGSATTGAGNPILIKHYPTETYYSYTSTPMFSNPDDYGQFTTDGSGSFAGTFGFTNTGDARFTSGNMVFPTIALAPQSRPIDVSRFALDQSITVLSFANTPGPNNGTFIQGTSSAVGGNLVALWDNVAGTGRPLSITMAEDQQFLTIDGATPWHTGFINGYDSTGGSWNTIIPNNNANGVRLIQQLDFDHGSVMGCSQDANGTWPTGSIATSNPGGGVVPLKISSTDAPLNNGACSGIPALTQANFTAINAPQYTGTGNNQRIPTMFYASISNLSPNTTYRYYTQAAIAADLGTASTGAGNSILIDYTAGPVTYTYSSGPSLNIAGGYGKFITDGNGNFAGSFGFVNTGNERFTPGNEIIPTIALTADISSAAIYRLALNQTVKALKFGTTTGANDGTFIKGTDDGGVGPGSIVAVWDNTTAAGRPLSITLAEKLSLTTGNGGTAWRTNFIGGYDSTFGSWNTIIPNSNTNGVRLIEGFEIVLGNVQGCSADDDGTWPTGTVITSAPTGGSAPIRISETDAPLYPGACYNVLPVKLEYIKGRKLNSGVALDWKVTCLSSNIVMEIERAADTRNFKRIGSIAATQLRCNQPFDFIDQQPVTGNNYYRLKMIDVDGKISYSPIVAIINAAKGIEFAGLYPSVVKSTTLLSVSSAKATTIETRISDMTGRLMKSFKQAVPAGNSTIKIDCSALAAGVYNLTALSEDATVKTIRFVKQ